MNQEPVSSPQVLRYIYSILTIIVVAATVAMGSLYVAQNDESNTRDRAQFYHMDSYAESQRLAREARTLRSILEDAMASMVSDRSGAAGIGIVQIGYHGLLQSMRSRLARLAALQERFDGATYAATLERLTDRFDKIDQTLRDSQVEPESLASIEAMIVNIEQFHRLHAIAAETELWDLAARQGRRPRFLAILLLCLGFSALAVGYVIKSLRSSLVRQKETEIALAEARDRLQTVRKLDALGRLVGGVAHDFNNLLTAILGNAELLLEDSARDETLKSGLREIRTAGTRAAVLTQQLLAFSRRQQTQRSVVDINELIADMESVLHRTVGADVELACEYAGKRCNVDLDSGQFQQMMLNLITNARDAMPKGGTLSVSTENVTISDGAEGLPDGEYVRLSVSDTGVGMDHRTRQHLFEPFFTTKEEGGGTGLGLSTVHGIVADLGGHITVDSREGEGTSFRIFLPPAEHRRPAELEPIAPSPPRKGSETVLVVDDDKQILRFVEKGLSSLGYRVLTASGGAAGLAVCERERDSIHVILSDVVMSGINGPRFMAGALRLCPEAVAIYMSAYTRDVILWQRTGRDEIPVLSKPFDLEALTQLIRDELDRFDDNLTSSDGP